MKVKTTKVKESKVVLTMTQKQFDRIYNLFDHLTINHINHINSNTYSYMEKIDPEKLYELAYEFIELEL